MYGHPSVLSPTRKARMVSRYRQTNRVLRLLATAPIPSKKTSSKKTSERNRVEEDKEAEEEAEEEEGEDLLAPKTSQTEELQVDFTFLDPTAEDESWIRALIQKGWTSRLVGEGNVRALAAAVAGQAQIGTLVKTESEEDSVFGFATVLDIEALPKHVEEKLRKNVEFVKAMGKSRKIGWLLKERFVNLPEKAASALFTCLRDDLVWARKNAATSYDDILIFAPCDVVQEPKGKKQKLNVDDLTNVEFGLDEDVVFAAKAKASFNISVPRKPVDPLVDDPPESTTAYQSARVMLLSKEAFESSVDML